RGHFQFSVFSFQFSGFRFQVSGRANISRATDELRRLPLTPRRSICVGPLPNKERGTTAVHCSLSAARIALRLASIISVHDLASGRPLTMMATETTLACVAAAISRG